MGKKNKVIKINPHKNLIQYILASVFAITGANLFAQTPTTFTATNVKVMDTLTSNDLIRASEIVATETITAKDDIVAEQDVKITGALTVTNTATFKGIVDLGNGIGFKSIPATSSHPTVFKFGTSISLLPPSNGLDPEDLVACANPILGANPLYSFVGSLKASSYLPNSTGSTILGHDGANGILDVQGTASNNGVGGLLVNYYCKRNVFICMNGNSNNPQENHIYMGEFVRAAKHVEIGNNSTGITDASNTAMQVNVNAGIGFNANCFNNGNISAYNTTKNNIITSSIYGDGMFWQNTALINQKMLRIYDGTASTLDQDKFIVLGDGRTQINCGTSTNRKMLNIYNSGQAGSAANKFAVFDNGKTIIGDEFGTSSNYMLTVNGKIGAREIKVSIQNPWPDYVFAKNYNLKTLEGVETYINKNKHLPNIPSAEELKKEELGLNIAEMQGLQMEKIEEIYLYLIELNKQVKELKRENELLKAEIRGK